MQLYGGLPSDLFGKLNLILGKALAEPNNSFPLPNKSGIGKAVNQTTVLLFLPRKCLNFSNFREIWMAAIRLIVICTRCVTCVSLCTRECVR